MLFKGFSYIPQIFHKVGFASLKGFIYTDPEDVFVKAISYPTETSVLLVAFDLRDQALKENLPVEKEEREKSRRTGKALVLYPRGISSLMFVYEQTGTGQQ